MISGHNAHTKWRRLSAQANEADIRVVPEPGLVLIAGVALLAVLNARSRKKENPNNAAWALTGVKAINMRR